MSDRVSNYLMKRPRRLRRTSALRQMIQETRLDASDFIYPVFVTLEEDGRSEIPSMPGCFRFGMDRIADFAEEIAEGGVLSILLFGIPENKDEVGSGAYDDKGVVQQAVRKIKERVPDLVVITDVCLCEYTSHGHCGVLSGGEVDNDPTLELLCKTAVSHARAGTDIVAPSDMMDGRVAAIREALDGEGFHYVSIFSYAAKFASSFYGPFRDAAECAPQFGDRRSYQMDPPNRREAMREIELDLEQGADVVIVKPGLAYLDIVREARSLFEAPLAVYNVSGEYSMVKAAAGQGWIDERNIVLELLMAFKRAGADLIITYHAIDAIGWLKE